MLIIYTPHITPRIEYIVQFLLGQDALLTNDLLVYGKDNVQRINYSAEKIHAGECYIIPDGLLTKTGIETIIPAMGTWSGLPTLFPSSGGDIPFDIFSAAFYLLSRYEEYGGETKDEHGRYNVLDSMAYRHAFLDRPLIDEWMIMFRKQLGIDHLLSKEKGNKLLQPQYDIDIAYRYKGHSPFRNILGFYKDLLSGNFSKVSERSQVYGGKAGDPYDVYDWLDTLHIKYGLLPVYFFLVAEKRKRPDLNLSPYTKEMRTLIRSQAGKYEIGLHPSVQSTANEAGLLREKQLLSFHADREVTVSRQHYLKMSLPDTYRQLLRAGITNDHTMGYGPLNGFRASTTGPFFWYDLLTERITSLLVHPFFYMDSTAIFHERLNAEMALERMEALLNNVKRVNGSFRFVMHNHFLANNAEWMVWRDLYERFLERNA